MRRAILSIGRKNGKTALIACFVLVHLIGPEGEQNGEIVSAAKTKDQAAEVFKMCRQMVEMDEDLAAKLGVISSIQRIVCYGNGSHYQAISREASSKHGGNPSVVIYDELAQASNRDLYDVLDTSMGAREQPLFFAISTQSDDPSHIFSELVDDGLFGKDPTTLCHLYAVPDDEPNIFLPRVWFKANPGLGDFKSMADFEALAGRAKRRPSFENVFRNLYLNQRVSSAAPMIATADWAACRQTVNIEDGARAFAGLDLSMNEDLSSLVVVSDGDFDQVVPHFWKPKMWLGDHEKRDHKPYGDWAESGYITATPGRIVDYGCIADTLAELNARLDLVGVAYDRWRVEYLLKALDEKGIEAWIDGKTDPIDGGIRLVPWSQSFTNMGPSVDAVEEAVLNKTLIHDNNPVLSWCMTNTFVISDAQGNRKIDKRKTRFRIDGAVALTLASGLKARDSLEEPKNVATEVPADYEM